MNYFFTSKTSGTIINFGVHNSNLSSCILIPQAPFDYCLFVYTTRVLYDIAVPLTKFLCEVSCLSIQI